MTNFSRLVLKSGLGPNVETDDADIVVIKRSLKRLGHYRPLESKLSGDMDRGLLSAIKSFQGERRLRVDGIIEPNGETATEIGRLLSAQTPVGSFSHASSRKDSAPSESECDHLYWNVDIPTCRAIEARRGKQAAARCYHTATFRYAACLRGTPINQLPPLDTYNQ